MAIDMLEVQEYFGLKRNPLGRVFDRTEVFRSKKYRRSMKAIAQWVREGEACCVLGAIGSGKTTLVSELVQNALAETTGFEGLELVFVGHPDRERMVLGSTVFPALQEHLGTRIGITKCQIPSNAQRRFNWLKSFLGDQCKDKRFGLVIDEAHRLPGPYLKGLKELTEIGWATRESVLGLILVGHPALENSLRRHAPDVYKRVLVGDKFVRDVSDMQVDEVHEYLRHRCSMAGCRTVFHKSASVVIARCAETPLDINGLAWQGMDTAFKAGAKQVRAMHVTSGMTIQELVAITRLSQGHIADKIGMSKGTVSAVLNRSYTGDATRVERNIRDYLGKALKTNGAAAGADAFQEPGGSTAAQQREQHARRQKVS